MQFLCKNCFADKELKGFITSLSNISNCTCCSSKDVEVIRIEELLDYFKELFDNFTPVERGESLLSKIQGNWNLFTNHECGHKILNQALYKINSNIKNSEDLVDFNNEIYENVNYWHQLKEQLKWERRYLTDINLLTEDLGWDGFFESKVIIEKKDTFYRARLHHNSNEPAYTKEKMFCPPKTIATAGRANSLGIPYLYLSDNEETVLYETRASYLDEASIALFKLRDNLTDEVIISDFTEVPSLFHPNEVTKKIKSTLLKQLISRDLSKPMRRYDSELDYIPTQFICEFLRVFTGVQGIRFRSSLHNIGNNIVIFNQEIMDCIKVEKVRVTKVTINFMKV